MSRRRLFLPGIGRNGSPLGAPHTAGEDAGAWRPDNVAMLHRLWGSLPDPVREALVRTGLPYAAGFVLHYGEKHRIENFAANLEQLKLDYSHADASHRAELSRRFSCIVDALVLPNAVTKTTWGNRLGRSLIRVLAAVQLPGSKIRVLDIPSSTGIASLESLAILRQRYQVASYVLADKYHELLYDPDRRCIFDRDGHLLQVAFRRHYFSAYRGHVTGNVHTLLSTCVLSPHALAAWYLRRRHRLTQGTVTRRLRTLHPDVERLIAQGIFDLRELDVFQPLPGRYELILSFNLLQRNYFPADTVRAGVSNLAAALAEGGVLILGNTDSFLALQKEQGALVTRLQEGSF